MPALFRRIDYIRQVQSTPQHGLERGNNPYAQKFGTMPIDEIRRLVAKLRKSRGDRNTIGVMDFIRECGLHRTTKLTILLEAPETFQELQAKYAGYSRFGSTRIRRVSRWLAMWENGMILKKDGVITYLAEPPKNPDGTQVRKPDHVMRVWFDERGKPRMGFASRVEAPKTMPKLFQKLETLGRK